MNDSVWHNSLGYRGALPEFDKDSGEYRIFMAGGSTVWNGNPPIPELVEKELNQMGYTNVKVFNWGAVASNSGMELSRLTHEIGRYEPDLVVFYNGGNDMTHPFYGDPRPGYPYNFMIFENNPLMLSPQDYPVLPLTLFKYGIIRFLFKGSFSQKFTNLSDLRKETGFDTDPWRDSIAKCYLENLELARVVSNAFGAEFVAILQPLIFFKKNLSDEEKEIGFLESKSHLLYLQRKIRNALSSGGYSFNFIDLSDFFNDYDGTIFVDPVHLTQRGREMISHDICNRLTRLGVLPPNER
ncbi:MAG: hypothetical protein JW861_12050 [Bacteroidales bacterium]|nr:hypothetical protein [Bacteroidales bacterium]